MLKKPNEFAKAMTYLNAHGISVYKMAVSNFDQLRIYIDNNGQIKPSQQLYTHKSVTAALEELVLLLYHKVSKQLSENSTNTQ